MVFLPLKGRNGFFLLSVAISWMGAWHPPYFCSTELYRFLGGNGQFSPTKFQTTFFQQERTFENELGHLTAFQTSRRGSFVWQQAATFFSVHGQTRLLWPRCILHWEVLLNPNEATPGILGKCHKNPMISFTFSGDACLHSTSDRSTVKPEASQPCQKKTPVLLKLW